MDGLWKIRLWFRAAQQPERFDASEVSKSRSSLVSTKAQEFVSTTATKYEPVRILIADDQADVREELRLLLKAEGFSTETVRSPAAALEAVQCIEFDIQQLDLYN